MERSSSAVKSSAPTPLDASHDILGALSAALARVDSWMASDSDNSESLRESVSVQPGVARRPIARELVSPFYRIAARVSDPIAPEQRSTSTNFATSTEAETAPSLRSNANPVTTISSSALDPMVVSVTDRFDESTRYSSASGSSALPNEPMRPYVQPVLLQAPPVAPIWTPSVPEPPVLSIGRIEVDVVLPHKHSAPAAVAPPAPTRYPSANRAFSGFEAPRRAFGWRQN
jgi:hypothetical protein